jgi:hypothetical protein
MLPFCEAVDRTVAERCVDKALGPKSGAGLAASRGFQGSELRLLVSRVSNSSKQVLRRSDGRRENGGDSSGIARQGSSSLTIR